jgi:hypothetical protein
MYASAAPHRLDVRDPTWLQARVAARRLGAASFAGAGDLGEAGDAAALDVADDGDEVLRLCAREPCAGLLTIARHFLGFPISAYRALTDARRARHR